MCEVCACAGKLVCNHVIENNNKRKVRKDEEFVVNYLIIKRTLSFVFYTPFIVTWKGIYLLFYIFTLLTRILACSDFHTSKHLISPVTLRSSIIFLLAAS